MAVVAAAALVTAGLGVYKYFHGRKKEKDAKKAREALANPFYQVQQEYYQNANAANALAQGGLPAATKDYYTNQGERGLSAGITALNSSGGNPNDYSKLFQTYNDGLGKISAVDAETHINNIKYYRDVNRDLAGQKTIQWGLNVKQPHDNTLKELSAAQNAGEATQWEGISDILGAATSYGTSRANANLLKKQNRDGYQAPALDTSGTSIGQYSSQVPQRTVGTGTPQIAQIADPFGNDEKNYQDYLDYMDYKRQHGE